MNDAELDRLLDGWKAPAMSPSLRRRVRGGFPQSEKHWVRRPFVWVLVVIFGFVALAVATAQPQNPGSDIVMAVVYEARRVVFDYFIEPQEARRAEKIRAKIQQSDPKVYVDGQLAGPLEYGPAATLMVRVGDEGYTVALYQFMRSMRRLNANGQPTGWLEAGHIHDNVIEFSAGGTAVRIECNAQLVDRQRGVFVRRMQE